MFKNLDHMCTLCYSPETNIIPDPTLRLIAERYLGIGETIFDMVQGSAVNSEYFKKDTRR